MAPIELWPFTYHDPRTGKRRRTTYRLMLAEARARYIDPQPVDGSREVQADGPGYGATLGAGTTPGTGRKKDG